MNFLYFLKFPSFLPSFFYLSICKEGRKGKCRNLRGRRREGKCGTLRRNNVFHGKIGMKEGRKFERGRKEGRKGKCGNLRRKNVGKVGGKEGKKGKCMESQKR